MLSGRRGAIWVLSIRSMQALPHPPRDLWLTQTTYGARFCFSYPRPLSFPHTHARTHAQMGVSQTFSFQIWLPCPSRQRQSCLLRFHSSKTGALYPKWRKIFHLNLISSSVAALAQQYFNVIKERAVVCNLNLPPCARS